MTPLRCAAAALVALVLATTTACGSDPAPEPDGPARPVPCESLGGLGAGDPEDGAASGGGAAEVRDASAGAPEVPAVLVFSRTEGFRHDSIEAALAWFGERDGDDLDVTTTEDTEVFTPAGLADFDVVVFANTTGDVLDPAQEGALQAWIEDGGGFVGVHSAADTEHDWAWYGDMVGGRFTSHPPLLQTVDVSTEAPDDPTVAHLDESWELTEELYNYDRNPRDTADVLLSLDEDSALGFDGKPVGDGFTMAGDHPIAWSRQQDAGRVWYTNLGHSPGTWEQEWFGTHLLEGIRWAAAPGRWSHQVVTEDIEAPAALDVADSGLVLWTERAGTLQVWDPASGTIHVAGEIPTRVEGEGGLIGVRLAPDAAETGHVFTYTTAPGTGEEGTNVLTRYTLDRDCRLDLGSGETVLEVPNDFAGHQGGDIVFLADGTLLLGTGDNTNNVDDEYAPIDERPGHEQDDAGRTSANPDDLRGKILRIEPDGDIPEGNLFPDGEGGRPEIYAMGVRNPYRIAATPDGERIWWGDIGPDAVASGDRGPQGYDELNTATEPGDYGWPYCIGDRLPYREWDAATGEVGEPYDCGDTVAPLLAYDYTSLVDPAIGKGVEPVRFDLKTIRILGRALMVGPYYVPDPEAPFGLPIGESLLLHEFGRNRILAGTPQDDGTLAHLRRLAPWAPVNTPVDVEVAPDGSLFILETGKWSEATSGGARLTRLAWSPEGPAPDLPASKRAEPLKDEEGAVDGEEVFQLQCASCHGADGGGGRGPSLLGIADRLTEDEHLTVVREGRNTMPAWDGVLTDEEIAAVVAYERTLQPED